ncbi:MAG: carbon monoxide dehydrogenase subunit G [Pseudomonadota bacterium]
MDLSDEVIIEAPRDAVYAALNDPEILKACIPGCEELIQHADDHFDAKVVLKVGPVKARFSGTVRLDKAGGPEHFTLTGEGNGGTAGFAKGGADVTLAEDSPGTTTLTYTAHVDIGGKLAQLGSRLVQSTAKKLSAKFFTSFAQTFEPEKAA